MRQSSFKTIDLTFGAIFVVLMMIGANIVYWIPALKITYAGGEVPLTLQTFFAILAGLLLGKKLGAFSMIVYIAIGICGVPVFSEMKSGPMQLLLPTGGFLLSFILVAYVAGLVVEKFNKESLYVYITGAAIGLMINYGIGTPFMYFSLNYVVELPVKFTVAILMMVPFFIKDLVITMAIAVIMPKFITRLQKASLPVGLKR